MNKTKRAVPAERDPLHLKTTTNGLSNSTADIGKQDWRAIAEEAWDAPGWRDAAIEYHQQRGRS